MLTICFILAAVTVLFAVSCVILRRKGKSFEGMVCKFMASFGFISTAIVGYCHNPKNIFYFCLVSFALMFGLFGDVILGIKEIAPKFRGKIIPLGTVYFLIGHIFYLAAFIKTGGFRLWALLVGIAAGIFAFIMIKALKMNADSKLRVLMSVYYFALVYKAAAAAALMIETGSAAYIIAFIGSVFFVISDTCLGMLYFTPVKKKNFWVTIELSSYYPAQILLALSLAFV